MILSLEIRVSNINIISKKNIIIVVFIIINELIKRKSYQFPIIISYLLFYNSMTFIDFLFEQKNL